MVDSEEVDGVEELTYQGAMVDKEGGGNKDVMHRLQKACGFIPDTKEVGAARGIGRRARICLFKT